MANASATGTTSAAGVPMEQRSGWRALEQRNYRLFVAGQLVSLIGTWTQSVAQTWLVYRLTGSATWLGFATFCQQVPAFFFATLGGLIADRHKRRTILVCTQTSAMVLAFVLAGLTLSGHVRVAHVLVLAALLGAVQAIDSPTRQSFVLEMVGRENLTSAVAINTSMVTGASFVGPAIAGVAIQAVGEGWCFFVNGVSFLAVIAGLLAMRDLPAPPAGRPREPMTTRLLEGFRYVAGEERVRAVLVLLALTSLTALPTWRLMPVVASTVLHGDSRTLGWLMGASGAGGLVAGLFLAARPPRTFGTVALGCGLSGATLVAFSATRTLLPALALMVPLGAATMVQVATTNALIQAMTPDALRGRVMAIWIMIFMGFSPIGSVIAGKLTTAYGTPPVFAGAGLACALGAMAFGRWLSLRHPTATRANEGDAGAA
jgi:MFS family permease